MYATIFSIASADLLSQAYHLYEKYDCNDM